MAFKPTTKKISPNATAGLTSNTSIPDHLRSPLTTKTWQQSVVQNYTMRVITDGLMLRDTPYEHGVIILELVLHSTVKLGTEESQFSGDILWKNVISGSIKGWVLASGLESYDQPQQRHSSFAIPDLSDQLGVITTSYSDAKIERDETIFSHHSSSTSAATFSNSEKNLYRVLLKDLALRTGPDIKSRLLKKLNEGQVVECHIHETRGNWVTITADGEHGWVARHWLQPITDHNF